MTETAGRKPYPELDYFGGGKFKPDIWENSDGTWYVEIKTTYSDTGMTTWAMCPHRHRTKHGAERCMWAWNDYAHDQRLAALPSPSPAVMGEK